MGIGAEEKVEVQDKADVEEEAEVQNEADTGVVEEDRDRQGELLFYFQKTN